MAIVHRAELTPSKLEVLASWLPGQEWYLGGESPERVTVFRFDDPAGEVGLETFIVSSGSGLYHVPITYRSEALDGGVLVGQLEHSVLGTRWIYDGPSDPVYVATIRDAIVGAARDVDLELADGTPVPRLEWWGNAVGSGAGPEARALALSIARVLPAEPPAGAPTLTAAWAGAPAPYVVAWLSE